MDDDELEMTTVPSRKFRLIDLAILLIDSTAGFLDGVVQIMCSHANWKNDRSRFHESARADIERIVGE